MNERGGVGCIDRWMIFFKEWAVAAKRTLQVLQAVTDDKLGQSILEGHSTLGLLGWHLTETTGYFSHLAGLTVPMIGQDEPVPATAGEIVAAYAKAAEAVKEEAAKLSDEDLLTETGIASLTTKGAVLRFLIDHQTHHCGQMMVLLRQAGLPVPPVMGSTKEMQ
ncbi:DinB family protein [Paenibacillus sp. VCA1]|nr:DinB family protein [Paenibacillus sp. VCA1]MDR9853682.1 DinB family protein [Paenibacillus sp. VCA1]